MRRCEICHGDIKLDATRCSGCGAEAPKKVKSSDSQKILRVAIALAESAPACSKCGTPLVPLGEGLKCSTCGSNTPLER